MEMDQLLVRGSSQGWRGIPRKVHKKSAQLTFLNSLWTSHSKTSLPMCPTKLCQVEIDLYLHSQNSSLTYYGYSANKRNKHEIQSVEVGEDELVAMNWTFQMIKNYLLLGTKALFTMNKGSTKEICHATVVSSIAVNQVSHALMEEKPKRKQFNPKGLYSNIMPHTTQHSGGESLGCSLLFSSDCSISCSISSTHLTQSAACIAIQSLS